MSLADDIAFVGQLLDRYAVNAFRRSGAQEDPEGAGVPPAMQVGEVDDDGYVDWQILPSTLTDVEVCALEREFEIQFPPLFRAYLLARFHLFDQVGSRKYGQQILMTDTPMGKPLAPIRFEMTAWRPLIDAGFIPFAEWGDGWGPMCFDVQKRSSVGDCPINWFEHEWLHSLDEKKCRQRENLVPLVQPLYSSCREFLLDVFGAE
jgi:hypothetical protein